MFLEVQDFDFVHIYSFFPNFCLNFAKSIRFCPNFVLISSKANQIRPDLINFAKKKFPKDAATFSVPTVLWERINTLWSKLESRF